MSVNKIQSRYEKKFAKIRVERDLLQKLTELTSLNNKTAVELALKSFVEKQTK